MTSKKSERHPSGLQPEKWAADGKNVLLGMLCAIAAGVSTFPAPAASNTKAELYDDARDDRADRERTR